MCAGVAINCIGFAAFSFEAHRLMTLVYCDEHLRINQRGLSPTQTEILRGRSASAPYTHRNI